MVKPKDNEPRIVDSERSGSFEKNGYTVEVFIYKLENIDGWTLEVVDANDVSTVWDEEFATDEDAWLALMKVIDEEGIESLVAPIDRNQMH